jgi:hypothetical protein
MLVNHASVDYQNCKLKGGGGHTWLVFLVDILILFFYFLFFLDMSYQVLLMVGYFKPQDIIEADLISLFGNGISNWLELDSLKRKRIGLV